ncbi:MAG: FtsQ-type POTRA domain-containing protein [Myxococcales bacterium]|nr:FtsQ-type POTRA domain-containing protein [Myxococcales bacterium]
MALLPTAIIYGHRYVMNSQHFRVQQVEVTGHANVPVEEVLEIAGLEDGPNLLAIDLEAIEASLEMHPWIRDARVERELPDKLSIGLSEREPAAILALGAQYLVDRQGVPFKRVETGESFPTLPILTGLVLDDFAEDAPKDRKELATRLVREALMVIGHWKRGPFGKHIEVGEVTMDPLFGHSVVLGIGDENAVGARIHLGFGDVQRKLSRLETVISDARRKGKRVLEVRLDNIKDPNRVAVRFRSDTSADPEAAARDDENEPRPGRERHPVVTIGAVGADTGPATGLSDGEARESGGAAGSGEAAPSGSEWRKHRG